MEPEQEKPKYRSILYMRNPRLANSTTPIPQMDMGVKPTLDQLIADTKYRLQRRESELKLRPVWSNFAPVLAIVSSLILALVVLVGAIMNFAVLPPEIPLYYDTTIKTWQLVDKSIVIVAPLIYLVGVSIIGYLIYRVFSFDKRLSIISSWVLVFINVMTLFAVAQIVSLIT